MQTLHTIVLFLGGISYAAMTFFACYAFIRLRRMGSDIFDMGDEIHTMLAIAVGEHIRKDVEELNSMKERFDELLEEERFEDASRLKKIIEQQEHVVEQSIDRFKKAFGEDAVRVEMTNLEFNTSNDYESN